VHIYAERWNKAKGVQFHRVQQVPGPGFVQILTFARNTHRMIQQEHYDIIHSFERTFCQDVYGAGDGCHREWLERRSRGETIFKRSTYLVNPLHLAILSVEKKIYRDPRLKLVIANSQRVKNEIVHHYNFPPEKIHVQYHGIASSFLDAGRSMELPPPFMVEEDEKMILFLGSGFERKNLATAIKALALIYDPRVRLWVVGRNACGPYRRLARKLGIEQRVVFAGPQVDPIPFYARAHAFVLPSIYEPFGLVCLEALVFRLPVVTSRVCGFSELIREGENGFVIEDPLNPTEIAEKLCAALKLGKLPPQRYPTVADNVQEMVELYEMIQAT
jgi:UDP-glucose:(heptosyl)LPS alpha-1,3-glucosyltransferase